jgi:hypothetical protein
MSANYKKVCIKCKRFFKVVREVIIEEGMPAGVGSATTWLPYKLFHADLLRCEGCGTEIAVMAGCEFSEHYMSDYKQRKEERPPLLMVEDC